MPFSESDKIQPSGVNLRPLTKDALTEGELVMKVIYVGFNWFNNRRRRAKICQETSNRGQLSTHFDSKKGVRFFEKIKLRADTRKIYVLINLVTKRV